MVNIDAFIRLKHKTLKPNAQLPQALNESTNNKRTIKVGLTLWEISGQTDEMPSNSRM